MSANRATRGGEGKRAMTLNPGLRENPAGAIATGRGGTNARKGPSARMDAMTKRVRADDLAGDPLKMEEPTRRRPARDLAGVEPAATKRSWIKTRPGWCVGMTMKRSRSRDAAGAGPVPPVGGAILKSKTGRSSRARRGGAEIATRSGTTMSVRHPNRAGEVGAGVPAPTSRSIREPRARKMRTRSRAGGGAAGPPVDEEHVAVAVVVASEPEMMSAVPRIPTREGASRPMKWRIAGEARATSAGGIGAGRGLPVATRARIVVIEMIRGCEKIATSARNGESEESAVGVRGAVNERIAAVEDAGSAVSGVSAEAARSVEIGASAEIAEIAVKEDQPATRATPGVSPSARSGPSRPHRSRSPRRRCCRRASRCPSGQRPRRAETTGDTSTGSSTRRANAIWKGTTAERRRSSTRSAMSRTAILWCPSTRESVCSRRAVSMKESPN